MTYASLDTLHDEPHTCKPEVQHIMNVNADKYRG